ncbi:MAG: CoA pyrophosphatase [Acidimicrobiales bacterium]
MTPPEARPPRFEGHRYPQIIPEPGEILAGGPPPWAGVTNRTNLTLTLVTSRFREAHRLLGTDLAPQWPVELVADDVPAPVSQRSAVLVALFEEEGETHVVLTRRSFTMRAHRGEISFPGGRSHEGETPVETALREADEEIGLSPSAVTPLGWLNPLATFASGSAIFPIVGTVAERPTFVIQPSEVDRAFSVALSDLVAEGAYLEERWRRAEARAGSDPEGYFPLQFFRVPDDVIWGATARVLSELLSVVLGVPEGDRGGSSSPSR